MFALHSHATRVPRTLRLDLFRTLASQSRPYQPLTTSPLKRTLYLTSPRTSPASLRHPSRPYSSPAASPSSTPASSAQEQDLSHLDQAERQIHALLTEKLSPTALEVKDVSGGCGSMYAISVTSEAFRGLSVMKQHRLVNGALKGVMEGWHGCQVRTRVP
ncbi:hypothetical protein B9Z65_3101 [Elsinoe australis]|uniref:Bola-like protein n=1 Tax=Elsinoe australis TaxID=40998 RepID=A0A2P7ZUE5_9PEZI|nr:hypothetical protein B9Z65_3101 [Elsinoe australis]